MSRGAGMVRLAVACYTVVAAVMLLSQVASTGTPAATVPGDAVRGGQVFEKRCTGCHALNRDREGPHLAGVYGRTAGTVSGFDYSDALKNAHIVWNKETLERWLTDPQAMFPGAEMDFFVKDPQERVDVIAFLKQQSGK
jgi:cytochrome c